MSVSKLNEIKQRIELLEPLCPNLTTPYGVFPTKGGDSGDDVLWNGLLATVGYARSQSQVECSQAQGGEKRAGMWYRNPLRRSNDNEGHAHYFSRDMSLGVLLMFASSNAGGLDSSSALWLDYVNKNRACSVKKPAWMGKGCLVRSPMYRFSPDDDRSNITPSLWSIMGRVWASKGLPLHSCMQDFAGADGDVSIASADIVPVGYQLHLFAVQAYLKIILGQSAAIRTRIAEICYIRQPDNLFYKLIYQEGVFADDLDLFLGRCPNPSTFTPADYWLWEKSDQDPKYSCGWDWVFLGKLLLSLQLGG